MTPGLLGVQRLTVPMDGAHIEVSPGTCVLPTVPDEPAAGPLHVVVHQP